jgi:hypothetical protein
MHPRVFVIVLFGVVLMAIFRTWPIYVTVLVWWAFVIYTTIQIIIKKMRPSLGIKSLRATYLRSILRRSPGSPAACIKCCRGLATMKIQVVVTRTDAGATTKLMSKGQESSKNYGSWDEALKERGAVETHQYGRGHGR